ncbi:MULTISPECIES: MmcQ/YjbR family DNA-binding protein [unclassified Knoellia]|uniref:MmcQ/YjbR family DNA-binding protein n=1 Tax=Knoellia altitudinis TaxID=3404795 RepID=UPI00362319F0
MASVERPLVPGEWIERISQMLGAFPEVHEHDAWIGMAWKVRSATIAHIFGGEDQLFRITFRAEPDEVAAFEHMGAPYFKASWGGNVVGLLVDDDTDWEELSELLTDSYCIQAPPTLAEQVPRPT